MPKKGELVYHRKDGLWEARYVKEIDMFGKKKYGSAYGHSCKEAKAKRQNIVDNIRLFQSSDTIRDMTVSQLVNEYLCVSQNRIKLSTYQRYQSFLENHIKYLEKIPVVYLTATVLHKFALERVESGLSPRSVNSVLVFLHSCLKYGHRQYNLPLPDILYLSVAKKEMRVLSQDEQRRLEAYLLDNIDIYKLGVLLALYTGLRVGELCALRWEDIDDNSIKVRRTVQRLKSINGSGTELYIGPPKTNTSTREIPIVSFLQEKVSYFKNISKQEYVLGTQKMPLVEPRIMQVKFKKYLCAAGIENVNFHVLRHTFATRCVECGFEIKSLSDILGHANVQITLNRYVHPSFQLKIDNIEKLTHIW